MVASLDACSDGSLSLTVNDDEAGNFVERLAVLIGVRGSRLSIVVVAVQRLLAQVTSKALQDAADNLSISRGVEARSGKLRHKRDCVGGIGMNGNPKTTRL